MSDSAGALRAALVAFARVRTNDVARAEELVRRALLASVARRVSGRNIVPVRDERAWLFETMREVIVRMDLDDRGAHR